MGVTSVTETLWITLAITAQIVFAMRFVWQWIVSERRKESVIPAGFWYFSLVGGLMLTVYAMFRDPVLLPGQAAGVAIYVRNLMLIRQSKRAKSLSNQSQPPAASPPQPTQRQAA